MLCRSCINQYRGDCRSGADQWPIRGWRVWRSRGWVWRSSDAMQRLVISRPLSVRRHSHEPFHAGLCNQQTFKWILMPNRKLSSFDHIAIQHQKTGNPSNLTRRCLMATTQMLPTDSTQALDEREALTSDSSLESSTQHHRITWVSSRQRTSCLTRMQLIYLPPQ